MKRSETKEFIVLVYGKEDTIVVATYNRIKAEWKFREEDIKKYAKNTVIRDISEFKSKKDLLKRVQASTELRRVIDHLSMCWVDYDEIKDTINMTVEDIQKLYGTENAFRHNSLFYIEKSRLLLQTYADKEDGRFNSKEMKRNLHLIYT